MQDVLCTSCSTVIHMDFVDNCAAKSFPKKRNLPENGEYYK